MERILQFLLDRAAQLPRTMAYIDDVPPLDFMQVTRQAMLAERAAPTAPSNVVELNTYRTARVSNRHSDYGPIPA